MRQSCFLLLLVLAAGCDVETTTKLPDTKSIVQRLPLAETGKIEPLAYEINEGECRTGTQTFDTKDLLP